MKKEEELLRLIPDLVKETKKGCLNWKIVCQTTEYNEVNKKPIINEEGIEWIVDECYVSYECEYKGKTFVMISYEMIHSAGDKKNTTNLIFLPPLGIRYFDINVLLPYSVEADKMLVYEVNQLWLTILDMYKNKAENISLDVSPRELVIE